MFKLILPESSLKRTARRGGQPSVSHRLLRRLRAWRRSFGRAHSATHSPAARPHR